MKAKYVIFEHALYDFTTVLFPIWIQHVEIRNKFENSNIVSAGFVEWNSGIDFELTLHVTHGSTSLGIKRNEEQEKMDEKILTVQFRSK